MILSKNKFISSLVFGLVINLLLATRIAECAPAAGNNVVVISMQEIMQISELGGKKHQSLTKLQTDKMTQIQKKQQDFERKAKSLEARSKTVDAVLIVKEQEDLLAERQAIEAFVKAAEGELQRAISREMAQIGELVREAVKELASSSNWDIVFLRETGEMIYCSDKANISKVVAAQVDKLNQKAANAKPAMPDAKTTKK
jgi:Skp family chaperone for outer membrane proteins